MIALDIETSGIDPLHNSILSIGAIDTDEPTNQFYDECRAWDGSHVNEESLAINGFTKETITDTRKMNEAELVQTFLAWAMDRPTNRTIVGQNAAFDRGFLEAACKRAGIECPFAHRIIDTHALVWLHMTLNGVMPPVYHQHSGINLTAALAYCGLPAEPKPHNALTGALSHAEIFSRIAYTKKMIPEFSSYEIPWAS
jgi:DNA polymerase III epsilon subunit-like protein